MSNSENQNEKNFAEWSDEERLQWYMENLEITEEKARMIIQKGKEALAQFLGENYKKPEEIREDEKCQK